MKITDVEGHMITLCDHDAACKTENYRDLTYKHENESGCD